MTDFRQRAADGLKPGDSFTITRTFTDEEVARFAALSQDYNPIHFDARFAQSHNFDTPICHGLLTASLVTEIGGQVGWLATRMSFRFKGPVYVGEAIACRLVITAIDPDGRARAEATITNEKGAVVLEAQISGIVPGAEQRKVLNQMLAEEDPTNGLAACPARGRAKGGMGPAGSKA